MSYDISLVDPVTGETLELPYEHLMIGGTYRANYDEKTHTFSPAPTTEAYLNVTYNYSKYYVEATEGDERFAHEEITFYKNDGTVGGTRTEYGIRGLNGKFAQESIKMLEDMIHRIEKEYRPNGIWLTRERVKAVMYLPELGISMDSVKAIDKFGFTHTALESAQHYNVFVDVWEGETDNYWFATAANALKPLYQLLAMAKLRPDGKWEVC